MAREKCGTEEREVGETDGWCLELLFLAGPAQSTVQARLPLPTGLACAHPIPIPIWITPASTVSLLARP
jgi:hypothetical protein